MTRRQISSMNSCRIWTGSFVATRNESLRKSRTRSREFDEFYCRLALPCKHRRSDRNHSRYALLPGGVPCLRKQARASPHHGKCKTDPHQECATAQQFLGIPQVKTPSALCSASFTPQLISFFGRRPRPLAAMSERSTSAQRSSETVPCLGASLLRTVARFNGSPPQVAVPALRKAIPRGRDYRTGEGNGPSGLRQQTGRQPHRHSSFCIGCSSLTLERGSA